MILVVLILILAVILAYIWYRTSQNMPDLVARAAEEQRKADEDERVREQARVNLWFDDKNRLLQLAADRWAAVNEADSSRARLMSKIDTDHIAATVEAYKGANEAMIIAMILDTLPKIVEAMPEGVDPAETLAKSIEVIERSTGLAFNALVGAALANSK